MKAPQIMKRMSYWSILVFSQLSLPAEEPSEALLISNSLNQAGSYLVKCQKRDGHFIILGEPEPQKAVEGDSQLLDFFGTLYGLCQWGLHDESKREAGALAATRAKRLLTESSLQRPVRLGRNLSAFWSGATDDELGEPMQATLRDTGSGLVALMSMEQISPRTSGLSELQGLGNFLCFLQQEDGGFYATLVPSDGGLKNGPEGAEFAGAAALGLLLLFEKDPDPNWQESAVSALLHQAHHRTGLETIIADLWTLLATEKLLQFEKLELKEKTEELLRSQVDEICTRLLKEQITNTGRPDYQWGFEFYGTTLPAAISLESLLIGWNLLPEKSELREKITKSVDLGMEFLLRAQIQKGDARGAFPYALQKINPAIPESKPFNQIASEVRLNSSAHALRAMIRFHDLKQKEVPKTE